MNRRTIPAALAAMLLAAGCGRAADRVVDEFQVDVSTGRVDEAAALLARDAVIIFEGTAYPRRIAAQRWLNEAKRRRLGFPVGKAGTERAGWQVAGRHVSGFRLIHGDGYGSGGPDAPQLLTVKIDADVRGGLITRIVYELTPASRAALAAGGDQVKKVAAVFDGPPPMYNLGLFAADAVLQAGSTRLTGSPTIAGWVLSNGPASTGGDPKVQGSTVRWQGNFSTRASRQAGLAARPARFEVDVAGATSAAPNIRRYTVIFEDDDTSQPAPAASQPAPAASQPASASQPAASQPASASQPTPA